MLKEKDPAATTTGPQTTLNHQPIMPPARDGAVFTLQAQREGGRMLAENPEYGRGKKLTTVADFGIDHHRATRWQLLACMPDLEARFWAKVDKNGPGGCWLWTGTTTRGYGLFHIGSRTDGTSRKVGAHRFAYELLVGPIPDGLQLDHLCHNRDASCPGGWGCPHRRCVNPAHLEPVTSRVNTLRGKTNGAKARCPKGHPYDEVNTYVDKQGTRHCRACGHERKLRARTRCPQGHPYDQVNTYVDKQGRRHCRPCERLRTQQARARQRRAAA